MNKIQGNITAIEVSGNLSIVSVEVVENITLKAIVIETPDTVDYLQEGNQISVLFKETEVVIGVGDQHHISLQNRIPGKVKKIEKGILLSKIVLDTRAGEIISVISSNSVEKLELKEHSEVIAMIKLNEAMLLEP